MADDIPQIPLADEIYVHTGNTVNWNRLRRRLTQTSEEELLDCVGTTIAEWKESKNENDLQFATKLECMNARFREQLSGDEERSEYKITAKIFCPSMNKESLVEAVNKVLEELGISYLETVLLSVPEGQEDVESVRPLWEALETMVHGDKVLSLGVAEFSKDKLEALYEWAAVKPCIVQINLATCCVVPPDLQEYAKVNDILLLTHNDPRDILPVGRLQELMSDKFTPRDGELWEASWVLRYSVLIKCRGVIKSKGYIVHANRDLKRRK